MPQENVYTEKRFRLFVVGVISASKVGIKIEKKFVKTEKKYFIIDWFLCDYILFILY